MLVDRGLNHRIQMPHIHQIQCIHSGQRPVHDRVAQGQSMIAALDSLPEGRQHSHSQLRIPQNTLPRERQGRQGAPKSHAEQLSSH